MKLELEIYGALCSTKTFEVNGIEADSGDFGEQGDISPETAEDYGCGDMQFVPTSPTDSVLEKYDITIQEYQEIQRRLSSLSFGACGWCI